MGSYPECAVKAPVRAAEYTRRARRTRDLIINRPSAAACDEIDFVATELADIYFVAAP